jgi:hypothetical protein
MKTDTHDVAVIGGGAAVSAPRSSSLRGRNVARRTAPAGQGGGGRLRGRARPPTRRATGPGSVEHAHLVRRWSDDLLFFAHTQELTGDERERLEARGIGAVEGEVQRLVVEQNQLTGVELAGGRLLERIALFIRPNLRPRLGGLLEVLGCKLDRRTRLRSRRRSREPPAWPACRSQATSPSRGPR